MRHLSVDLPPMDNAEIIREAVSQVSELRAQQAANPPLKAAVQAVKSFQSRRFAGTYADLLAGGSFQAAARFFLDELYCDKDFTERDSQFGRIAGALQAVFPQQVVGTAVSLAQLHARTEELDHAMADHWCSHASASSATLSEAARYRLAWQAVGQRDQREGQLTAVQDLGRELARLTRLPGLRMMLKMMRRPAQLAGLASLQAFLESGFDTFAEMSKRQKASEVFLAIVAERETALLALLFDGDPVACETQLTRTLGLAR